MIINISIALIGIILSIIIYVQNKKNPYKELLNLIPSTWTSLGILGTFIALVDSLKGLDMDDIDIAGLVTSIAPAFETSIIGISMALLTSVSIRIYFARQNKNDEIAYMNSTGENISPEVVLHHIFKEQKETNHLMANMVSTVCDEVITSVTKSLDDKISGILDSHMSRVALILENEDKSLQTISQNVIDSTCRLNDNYSESVKSMSDTFRLGIDNVRQKLLNEMEDISSKTTSELSSLYGVTVDKMNVVSEKTETAFSTSIEMLTKKLKNLTETMNASFSTTVSSLESSMEADYQNLINTISGGNDKLVNSLNASRDEWIKTAQLSIFNSFKDVESQLSNLVDKMETLSSSLQKNLKDVEVVMTKTSTDFKEVVANTDGISKTISSVCKAVETDHAVMADLSDKLERIIETSNSLLDSNYKLRYQILQFADSENSRGKQKPPVIRLRDSKKCPNCGTKNPIDAEFCGNCRHHFE